MIYNTFCWLIFYYSHNRKALSSTSVHVLTLNDKTIIKIHIIQTAVHKSIHFYGIFINVVIVLFFFFLIFVYEHPSMDLLQYLDWVMPLGPLSIPLSGRAVVLQQKIHLGPERVFSAERLIKTNTEHQQLSKLWIFMPSKLL